MSYESSASVMGELIVEIEHGYSGAVPADVHLFYLDAANVTTDAILTKTGASVWPVIKPKSHTVVLRGATISKSVSRSATNASIAESDSASANIKIGASQIPPTIHPAITIEVSHESVTLPQSWLDIALDTLQDYDDAKVAAYNASIAAMPAAQQAYYSTQRAMVNAYVDFNADLTPLTGTVTPVSLPATTPATFPTGKFIMSSNVSPYLYGLVRVTAVVVDVTNYV